MRRLSCMILAILFVGCSVKVRPLTLGAEPLPRGFSLPDYKHFNDRGAVLYVRDNHIALIINIGDGWGGNVYGDTLAVQNVAAHLGVDKLKMPNPSGSLPPECAQSAKISVLDNIAWYVEGTRDDSKRFIKIGDFYQLGDRVWFSSLDGRSWANKDAVVAMCKLWWKEDSKQKARMEEYNRRQDEMMKRFYEDEASPTIP